MKQDFFALLFENGTLGRKICTFLHLGNAIREKGQFFALWYHFKSRAKKSDLYFCHEIVFLL